LLAYPQLSQYHSDPPGQEDDPCWQVDPFHPQPFPLKTQSGQDPKSEHCFTVGVDVHLPLSQVPAIPELSVQAIPDAF
jgi:hypothetical protein